MYIKSFHSALLFTFLFIFTTTGFAQKLPKVQEGSLAAPKSIKIDGKANEWGDKFMAYNPACDVYYSVANNDKYLYIAIQATDIGVVRKIVRGGVVVSINTNEKTLAANCKAVAFPLINIPNEAALNSILMQLEEIKDDATQTSQTDSLVKAYNAKLASISTELRISTHYSIPDSTISVYNDKGILASGSLNNKLALTYEFRLPLEFLNVPYAKQAKFFYNIQMGGKPVVSSPKPASMRVVSVRTVSMESVGHLFSTTDFWGEYHLY